MSTFITDLRAEYQTYLDANYAEKIRLRMARKELTEHEMRKAIEHIKRFKQLERIVKSYDDILHFTYEYFSEDLNPGFANNLIPGGVKIEDAPPVHRELCDLLNSITHEQPNKRVCWAMPRGTGKSMFMSNIFPLYSIVFELRKYVIIVSETEAMAQKFLDFVNDNLKYNEKLREDFGELMSPNKNRNVMDNTEMFKTFSGIMCQAASISKQLRGARNGAFRPDLVVCDDLESGKNTNTLELRQKNLEWFNKVIIPIGTPEHMSIVYMGTTVHKNGLLTDVLKRADFQGEIYSAIRSYPDNEELWAEFEEIYKDQENENRAEDAMTFYEANKEEMNKGIEVLWPQRFPYHKLMMEKYNIGSKAFCSEFLNNPIDEETAAFKESLFMYYDDKDLYDRYGRRTRLDVYGFWDIAVGKDSAKGDYNAIIMLGRCRMTGILYILDAFAKRCPAHIALEYAIDRIQLYNPKIFGVETVQAQYDLYRQLQVKLKEHAIYKTKVKPIIPRGKKENRIEQLEPLFENATIRMKRTHQLLRQQLLEFPTGDHDDLPDALSQCVDLAGGVRKRTFFKKPDGY